MATLKELRLAASRAVAVHEQHVCRGDRSKLTEALTAVILYRNAADHPPAPQASFITADNLLVRLKKTTPALENY